MLTTLDVLKGALARIEKYENWTQGTYARDAHGMVVASDNPRASQFCAVGALLAAEEEPTLTELSHSALRALQGALGSVYVSAINDRGASRSERIVSHWRIVEGYRRAIANLEAEAAEDA